MTRRLILLLTLTFVFAVSACESAENENNSNANASRPAVTPATLAPAATPAQEASPANSELKAGDKVKISTNGSSAEATVVSVDAKAGKVTVRIQGEKQDKTVPLVDVSKQ